jgi:hypothetical protein
MAKKRTVSQRLDSIEILLTNHLKHHERYLKWVLGIFSSIIAIWGATKINGLLHWLASL